jgi:SAM-dependent methyltransferase
MKAAVRRLFGEETMWRISYARYALSRAAKIRIHPRECNVCGYRGYFHPLGRTIRPEARCPRCGSVERHRLLKLWLDQTPDALAGKAVLHFAAEPGIARLLKPLASRYVTADIRPGYDLALNIEGIDLPDMSFDAVICFHVLEHVDDRKALAELFRVLRPGGLLLLMFPVAAGWAKTYEDAAITDAVDREIHFGQSDHVRIFGADAGDRIRSAGFSLTEFTADGADTVRLSIGLGEKLFVARRAV